MKSSDFGIEALLDKSQAGPLLSTIHQLRADKEELLRQNQNLQAAAVTHSQEELAMPQAAVIAAEEQAAAAEQQLNTANERIEQLMVQGRELEGHCKQLQTQAQVAAGQALVQQEVQGPWRSA